MQNSIFMENLPLNHQLEIQKTLNMSKQNFTTLVNEHQNLVKYNQTMKTFDVNYGKQNFIPGLKYTDFGYIDNQKYDISDNIKINLPLDPPPLNQRSINYQPNLQEQRLKSPETQFNGEILTNQILKQQPENLENNQLNQFVMNPNLDQNAEMCIDKFERKQTELHTKMNSEEQRLLQKIIKQSHPGSLPQFQSRDEIRQIEMNYPKTNSEKQDLVHYSQPKVEKEPVFNQLSVKRNRGRAPQPLDVRNDINLSNVPNEDFQSIVLIEAQKKQIEVQVSQIEQLSMKNLEISQNNKLLQKQLKQMLKNYQKLERDLETERQEKSQLSLQLEAKSNNFRQLELEIQQLQAQVDQKPRSAPKVNFDLALDSLDSEKENLQQVLKDLRVDKSRLMREIQRK